MFDLDEFFVDVRVNLRGAYVGVSEQFLQNAQVHSRFQAVRGKAVAERVRGHLLVQVHRMLLYDFPGPHAGHRFSVRVEDDVVCRRVGEGAALFDPCAEIFFRLAAERYKTLLVAFANGHEPLVFKVDLRQLDTESL